MAAAGSLSLVLEVSWMRRSRGNERGAQEKKSRCFYLFLLAAWIFSLHFCLTDIFSPPPSMRNKASLFFFSFSSLAFMNKLSRSDTCPISSMTNLRALIESTSQASSQRTPIDIGQWISFPQLTSRRSSSKDARLWSYFEVIGRWMGGWHLS